MHKQEGDLNSKLKVYLEIFQLENGFERYVEIIPSVPFVIKQNVQFTEAHATRKELFFLSVNKILIPAHDNSDSQILLSQ